MPIDHNRSGTALTDEEQSALMQKHAEEFEEALQSKKDADAEFKNVCKRIKSEGNTADRVKEYLALKTPAGAAEAKANIEASLRMARWLSVDIGTQFDFFRDDGERGTPENASFKAGKEVGQAAGAAEAPKHFDAAEWMRGWHAGQAINASMLGKTGSGAAAGDTEGF